MADPAHPPTYEDIEALPEQLETYRLEAPHWVLLKAWRDEASVRAEPFDAFVLQLARLWPRTTSSLAASRG